MVSNTILPVAAVLAGKLFAHRMVSYVRELMVDLASNNVNVILRPKDPFPSYLSAFVLLNLSDIRPFKETFGMTILAGFAFACPAIVSSEGNHHAFCGKHNSLVADVSVLDRVLTQFDDLLQGQEKWFDLSKGGFGVARTLVIMKH